MSAEAEKLAASSSIGLSRFALSVWEFIPRLSREVFVINLTLRKTLWYHSYQANFA